MTGHAKQILSRRQACVGIAALTASRAMSPLSALAQGSNIVTWNFDRTDSINGYAVKLDGAPKVIDTAAGKALLFNGVNDGLTVDKHPLEEFEHFTFEALARFDAGGDPQPRWFHLAETDPATGLNWRLADPSNPTVDTDGRFTFEGRIADGKIYFESFCSGPAADGKIYANALIDPDKTHPLGQWFAVSQTYDGKMHRSYVNGILEKELPLTYVVQKKGRAGVGMRMNHVNYFKGVMKMARFASVALPPGQLLKVPDLLVKNP